mmetsp:Transcript_31290/g.52751  ORF Transcript_31290/g.52751 Transcript_31290/m.52751 type:complete len:83 (+) Transcript_31290:167-415(+)
MKKLAGLLHDGGKLFLGVPIGKDILMWNAHRIYGRTRFPLLIDGYRIVSHHSSKDYSMEDMFDIQDTTGALQPLFALEKISK